MDCSSNEPSPNAVGPSTHLCFPQGADASACWSGAYSTAEVWCLDQSRPGATTLTVQSADGVQDDTPTPADPMPVFLQLGDGSQFRYRVGGSWGGRADGLIPIYGCLNKVGVCAAGENVVLAGPSDGTGIDTSGTTWRVRVGAIGDPRTSFPPPTSMAVSQAWFIAGHRFHGD